MVYGNTSDVVRGLLVGCIVMSVILTVCGGSVHGILVRPVCVCVCVCVCVNI